MDEVGGEVEDEVGVEDEEMEQDKELEKEPLMDTIL